MVCKRIGERGGYRWFGGDGERDRANRLRADYVRKLFGIARVGLVGPNVELANLALERLRDEFVAHEAGRIKNAYVRSLGFAAVFAAALLFGMYAMIEYSVFLTSRFWADHKVFLLAAGGSAIGTWLSFSIRRVTLPFDQLAVLEEDLLDPSVRVIFVVLLTIMVCLLFWTGAINLEIGELKTKLRNSDGNLPIGAIALLIGLFCGIAERALATAISGRAAAFVRTLGT